MRRTEIKVLEGLHKGRGVKTLAELVALTGKSKGWLLRLSKVWRKRVIQRNFHDPMGHPP
jgi:hypothetical protein